MSRILVVDDVAAVAEQYAYDLRRLGDHRTRVATGGREALEILVDESIDCVILDLEMPGTDGFEVLRTLRDRGDPTPVIVYTGTGDFDRCARAVRLGAYSFIDKSRSMRRVAHDVEKALERGRLVSEVSALRARLGEETPLLGSSAAMRELKETIERLAPIPSPVLITGESGSGKELVARELHRLGVESGAGTGDGDGSDGRAGGEPPFLAINSAAIPENLVDSELFGHERGAFTGADRMREGAFEAAGEGTLFLDEVAELAPSTQARLLRVLEEREITRVGGNETIPVHARVIAATHRNLEGDVEAGAFRKDLYYRLSVHVLRVPPLRERLSDVPELAGHFLATLCGRFGLRRKELTDEALELLMSYDWRRNNVRELRNIVERLIIANDDGPIGPEHVPPEIRGDAAAGLAVFRPGASGDGAGAGEGELPTYREQKEEAERRIVVAALERNDWHITDTARELGLADHSSLLKIMRRHDLSRD